jgi:hypothetical protein
MTDATQLYALLIAHEWTAVVAVGLVAIVAVWRKVQPLVWGRLPRWSQYAIPTVVVGITGAAESLQRKEPWGVAIITGVLSAWATIGAVKTAGLALPKKVSKSAAKLAGSGIVLAVLMSGCGIVRSASDEVANVCEGYLAAQPEVQAKAQAKGVSPLVIAQAICLANDAGRAIWELFQVQQPEPGIMQAVRPAEQLERAKDHALAVAKQKGIL